MASRTILSRERFSLIAGMSGQVHEGPAFSFPPGAAEDLRTLWRSRAARHDEPDAPTLNDDGVGDDASLENSFVRGSGLLTRFLRRCRKPAAACRPCRQKASERRRTEQKRFEKYTPWHVRHENIRLCLCWICACVYVIMRIRI